MERRAASLYREKEVYIFKFDFGETTRERHLAIKHISIELRCLEQRLKVHTDYRHEIFKKYQEN